MATKPTTSATPARDHAMVNPADSGTIAADATDVTAHAAAVTASAIHRVRCPAIKATGIATAAESRSRRTEAFDAPDSPAPRVMPRSLVRMLTRDIETHTGSASATSAHRGGVERQIGRAHV